MSEPIPRYLLAGSEGLSPRLLEKLAVMGPWIDVDSVEELLGGAGADGAFEPGWVLLPATIEDRAVVDLLVKLADLGGAWSPLRLVERGEELSVVPLSPGFRDDLGRVLDRLASDGTAPALLSFRLALTELSRIRHDINNPLTAALAEAQLLLLDVEEGSESAKSLEVIERQLQRIRTLVRELTPLRSPLP